MANPADAVARPEVPALLARLARRLAVVAIVSGRPVAFLDAALGQAATGLFRFGLYGLERRPPAGSGDGPTTAVLPGAERYRAAVAAARQAVGVLPPGAELEDKGLTFVLHWRRAPDAGTALRARARALAAAHGLEAHLGKMSVEITPPGESDKGSVVRALAATLTTACFLGDDVGDLAAFRALGELAAVGVSVARVAVAGTEAPAELLAAADCIVEGPAGASALLAAVAARLDAL